MNVILSNPEKLEQMRVQMKKGGAAHLHVVSDFDRTLTYGSRNGVKIPSIISLLRDGKHLTRGYAEKAHVLFDTYHPIEIDPHISVDVKKKAMQEWWMGHDALLIESGLSFNDLRHIVDTGRLRFRDGAGMFLDFLYRHEIPLVIFSSSGCGEAIPLFFKKYGKDYSNIQYVINRFDWDEKERAVRVREPIIHVFNKDETILQEIPEVRAVIQNRKNVLLLGDSIGDTGMINGCEYDALITFGFLNTDSADDRKFFEEHFDVVLEGDGDFEYLNTLINDLCRKEIVWSH